MKTLFIISIAVWILSASLWAEQPQLRRGHAQTPKESKEELKQFRESYSDLTGWEKRKKKIIYGMLKGMKLLTLPKKGPLNVRFRKNGFIMGILWRNTDGTIDESSFKVEQYKDMLFFGQDNPRPDNAVKPNTPLP